MKNNFIHSSMSNMNGLADETYNFIYAVNSMHHLPSQQEQEKSFDEVFRILQPNGLFIVHEINTKNPAIRFYVNYIFPRIRKIDDGSEIWSTESVVKKSKFSVEPVDFFTFAPDFTPLFLMKPMAMLDKVLSRSPVSIFGAHVMYVLKKVAAT